MSDFRGGGAKPAFVQLGAGPEQRALLERLAATGLTPVVVDRAEAPAGLTPGAVHVRAPIDDPTAILGPLGAASAGLDVGAVLTSTDLGVGSVPPVARALGLPHATPESVATMDDEQAAKERLRKTGLLVPGRAAFEPGDHLDVNGFVFEGTFSLVSIGRRFFTPPPACVPIYGGVDAGWDLGLAERVSEAMQRAVDAFDYRHGPVKADAIDAPRGLVLLELAARFHGDVFSYHTAVAAGLAPAAQRWLARLGLGPAPIERAKQGAWLAVFADRAGRIRDVEGLDALKARPGFRGWIPRLVPGDRVGEPHDNRALVGFGILGFEHPVDLFREAREARAEVRVVVERDAETGSRD